MGEKLKAPFPYFGGKSRIAATVWRYLGDCDNYVEAFAGSAAVLLARPSTPKIETLNDADCYLANFWRSTQHDPEAVAYHADSPVNEVDLHARHRFLVGVEPPSPWTDTPYLHAMRPPSEMARRAAEFRRRMRTDPDYFDPKFAGWYCWGICCWIGSGWCATPNSAECEQMPLLTNKGEGQGIHTGHGKQGPPGGSGDRNVRLGGLEGQQGRGVHAKGEMRDGRGSALTGAGSSGQRGLNVGPKLSEQAPRSNGGKNGSLGVHADISDSHRPQLADAFARGRGVHGHDKAGTCAQRRAWLLDWFGRLRDRLRTVRVCCGDWLRVCDSESVTTRLGVTGLFLDPPYGTAAGRDMQLYAVDSGTVAADVRRYCLERGSNPQMRIVLAGYAGEGHEELEANGWTVEAWKTAGGYGNRGGNNANAAKERLWISPYCQMARGLFDDAAE